MDFLAGSYSEEGNKNSIYCISNSDTVRIISGLNPSYLLLIDNETILTINEIDSNNNLLLIDRVNNTILSVISTPGRGPCHLCLFKNKFIAISYYSTGGIAIYRLEGRKLYLCDYKEFRGSGINPLRQESSHVHSSVYSKELDLLYTIDLGTDRIISYSIDTNGILEEKFRFSCRSGDGPRGMSISGNKAFVVNELSNRVTSLKLSPSGSISEMGRFSTLPNEYCGESYAGHIELINSDLYISNRGYNSIVRFTVKEFDLINPQWIEINGSFPRHFSIIGSELVIANQESDTIDIYLIKDETLDFKYSVNGIYKPTVIVSLEI